MESGLVEIGDKSLDEIMEDWAAVVIATPGEYFHTVIDHRDGLLERAGGEADGGHLELAVTFYALWIEHTVNASLISGFSRRGYGSQVIDPLIRELRLQTKITALWSIAGFRQLSEDDLQLVERISQARKSFVHYKWRVYDDSTTDSMKAQLREIVDRAERLESAFNDSTSVTYWNNREDEIISGFHEYKRSKRTKRGGTSRSSSVLLTCIRREVRRVLPGLASGRALAVRPAGLRTPDMV